MTDATESSKLPTTANRSAGSITLGLAGLILGTVLMMIGSGNGAPAAVIIGVMVLLVGSVALLAGVHRLVENLDAATQALLERRP
jgi:hypothetical protein